MQHPPSHEQILIIDALLGQKNILVNAVAGSGKTTTMCHACLQLLEKNPALRLAIITYNSSLKIETRTRVQRLNLTNSVAVHSYHSFAQFCYGRQCKTDDKMLALINDIKSGQCVPKKNAKFDVFMIDEAQDMSEMLYSMLCAVIKQTHTAQDQVQYLVVGDVYQMVYGFKQANAKFLTEAQQLFPFTSYEWITLQLSTSYRLTPKSAEFVNLIIGDDSRRIHAGNHTSEDVPVEYNYFNCRDVTPIVNMLRKYAHEYGSENVAFLTMSTKPAKDEPRAVHKIVNALGDKLIFVKENDLVSSSAQKKHKITFSSYHGVKGCEFDCVILECNGFFDSEEDLIKCKNAVYVALTRHKSRLIIIQQLNSESYSRFKVTMKNWEPRFVRHWV